MTSYAPGVGAGPSTPTRPTETVSLLLPEELEHRAHRVLRHLAARELRLATAESCTGGLLASLFTDVPGVSHVFERGIVAYDPMAKHELLGVPQDLLEAKGTVCPEVAIAMAEGAIGCSHADVAIAVTGFADTGPEPGLVHMAVAWEGRPTVDRELHFGTAGRGRVRVACLVAAIHLLEEVL